MKGLRILLSFVLLTLSLAGRAQFFVNGVDPGGLRFRQIRTEHFRLIYPAGGDSISRAYALSLEAQYPKVGRSIGYDPSALCRKPQPVVLHTHHAYSNGMLMWAPRRMELYTSPDAYDPDTLPWMLNLTTHESRHASQMQVGLDRYLGAGHYVVGELSDVAWWDLYPGIILSEGDAVVAETSLTPFGRGREQDFLEYIRASFAAGEMRDWYRWAYGSIKNYTPDHYRAGYMMVSGMRTSFDRPDWMSLYLSNVFDRKLPLPFFNLQYTARQVSGMKLRDAFGRISADYASAWAANDSLRLAGWGLAGERFGKRETYPSGNASLTSAPVQPAAAAALGPAAFDRGTPLTAHGRKFSSFGGAVAVGDDIYAVETGLQYSPRLVRIAPDGSVSRLLPFAALVSDLRAAPGSLYWSEYRPDRRWSLASTSVIKRLDLATGRRETVLGGGAYFNPAPSDDGSRLAVVEYPVSGGSRLLVLDSDSLDGDRFGKRETHPSGNASITSAPVQPAAAAPALGSVAAWTAPDGMQIVQLAWLDDTTLAFSAKTDDGFGLYQLQLSAVDCLAGDRFGKRETYPSGNASLTSAPVQPSAAFALRTILPPTPAKIKQLRACNGRLYFVCSRNGVNELYSLSDGRVMQITNLERGGQDFVFNANGDTLRYAVLETGGRVFHQIPVVALTPRECVWGEVWEHPVAVLLSAQERALEDAGISGSRPGKGPKAAPETPDGGIWVSEPENYSKLGHLLKFHSWIPAYVDYDVISNFSLSSLSSAATLGATAFFQNDLSTATGSIGYSAAPKGSGQPWSHYADLRFNYSGWPVVLETEASISNSEPGFYRFTHKTRSTGGKLYIVNKEPVKGVPLISFYAKAYVPFNFSSDGWSRGLVPQLRYSVSNNIFDTSIWFAESYGGFASKDNSFDIVSRDEGTRTLYQNLTASIRGYAMLPTASAGVYPRWGIGAEMGIGVRPGITRIYEPAAYAYLYGYVPGIIPEHGIRLSALSQLQTGLGYMHEQRVTTTPRGFAAASSAVSKTLASRYPSQTKFTFDYLAAVLPVDWTWLCPVAYIRNFEVGAHCDATLLVPRSAKSSSSANSSGSGQTSNAASSNLGAIYSLGGSFSVRLGNLLWIPFPARLGVSISYNCGPTYETLASSIPALSRTYTSLIFSIDY